MMFAGCAGGDGSSAEDVAPAAEPTVDEGSGLGSITGTVANEEGLPVTGAEVAIIGTEFSVRSDSEGRFTFNGMAPGKYQVVAQRLGFESSAAAVTVEAAKVAELTLTLRAITVAEPYSAVDLGEGFITCAVGFPVVTLYPNAVGNACGTVFGEDKRTITFLVAPGIRETLSEVVWTPTNTVFGSALRSVNSFDGDSAGEVSSASPLVSFYDKYDDDLEEDAEWSQFFWAAYGGANTNSPGHSVNVLHEQRLTAYFSKFYHMDMPEGWTGVEG